MLGGIVVWAGIRKFEEGVVRGKGKGIRFGLKCIVIFFVFVGFGLSI